MKFTPLVSLGNQVKKILEQCELSLSEALIIPTIICTERFFVIPLATIPKTRVIMGADKLKVMVFQLAADEPSTSQLLSVHEAVSSVLFLNVNKVNINSYDTN